MADKKYFENIAIVGASGHIGSLIVDNLLKTGKHTVTAVTRTDSQATFAEGVKVARIDYSSEDSIVAALKGQDFLIITLSVRTPPGTHTKLCLAAAKAGIKYVMPNIYGYDVKKEDFVKEALHEEIVVGNLAGVKEAGLNYIILSCGFWYEWSLALGEPWYGFDIKNRSLTFTDDGKTKIDTSTWEHCGRAVSALLSLPLKPENAGDLSIETYKDKQLFVSSFHVSQRDMLDSLNRVKGTTDADWTIKYEKSDERYKRGIETMKAGGPTAMIGFATSMYTRVFFPNGDGTHASGGNKLSDEELGLPKESIDEATKRAVDLVESGWNPFA